MCHVFFVFFVVLLLHDLSAWLKLLPVVALGRPWKPNVHVLTYWPNLPDIIFTIILIGARSPLLSFFFYSLKNGLWKQSLYIPYWCIIRYHRELKSFFLFKFRQHIVECQPHLSQWKEGVFFAAINVDGSTTVTLASVTGVVPRYAVVCWKPYYSACHCFRWVFTVWIKSLLWKGLFDLNL